MSQPFRQLAIVIAMLFVALLGVAIVVEAFEDRAAEAEHARH